MSRPGLRVYKGKDELTKVQGGLGVAIVATSKGVMSDRAARAAARRCGTRVGLDTGSLLLAAAGLLAAVSKAGAPPMFGFVGKELLYKAKLDLNTFGEAVVLIAVVTNVVLVATALLVGVSSVTGPSPSPPSP